MDGIELKYLEENGIKYYLQEDGSITAIITGDSLDNVRNTTISYSQKTEQKSNTSLKVGKDIEGNTYISILKFNLPNLSTSAFILSAKVELTYLPSSIPLNNVIDVSEITTDWNETDVTWSDIKENFNSKLEDVFKCEYASSNDGLQKIQFNITNLAKRWIQDNNNYGVMLKLHEEDELTKEGVINFYSNSATTSLNCRPVLIINFNNIKSFESKFPSKNMKFKFGNSSINIYNGNFTSKFDLFESTTNTKSLYLSLYYDSLGFSEKLKFNIALGWRFNFCQKISELSDNDELLLYYDDNQIVHYLRKIYNTETERFEYSDGSIYAYKDNNEYWLNDTNYEDTKLIFILKNNEWNLSELKFSNDYSFIFEYDEYNNLVKIYDTNSKYINITYSSSYCKISSEDSNIYISLSENKILSINKNSSIISFGYNSDNLINYIYDETIGKYLLEYNSNNKIEKIYEIGDNDEIGKTVSLKYLVNRTIVKDNKSRINKYIFNNVGDIVCLTNNLSEDIENNSKASIDVNLSDSSILENFDCDTYLVNYSNNYIANSNFEDFQNFEDDKIYITNENSYFGKKSLKIDALEEQKVVFLNVPLKVGKSYTFSFYCETYGSNMLYGMLYHNMAGEKVEKFKKIGSCNFWKRNEISIYIDEDAAIEEGYVNVELYIMLFGGAYGFFDCFQLEDGESANTYNLIANSDFAGGIDQWSLLEYGENVSVEYKNYDVIQQNNINYLKINSDINKKVYLEKIIDIAGNKDDTYNLSFWYKNQGIDVDFHNESSIKVVVEYLIDDSSYSFSENKKIFNLNTNTNDWQYFSNLIATPEEYYKIKISLYSEYNYNSLLVTNFSLTLDSRGNLSEEENNKSFEIKSCVNIINHDNECEKICVSKDKEHLYYLRSGFENKYIIANYREKSIQLSNSSCIKHVWKFDLDEEGYYSIESALYSGYYINLVDDSLKLLNSLNCKFKIINNGENAISIKLKDEEKYIILDNSLLKLSDNSENSVFYMESFTTPFFIENKMITENNTRIKYDELGNKTTYYLNENGEIISTINANKSKIDYFYNNGIITKIVQDNKQIIYDYNPKEMLSDIINDNRVYTILYDNFSNQKKVLINGEQIAENIYEPNNGNLKEIQYANASKVQYKYDDFERISEIIKGNMCYKYFYDKLNRRNKLVIMNNSDIYDIYYYNYDEEGRIESLLKSYYMDNSREVESFLINKNYDSESNLSLILYQIPFLKKYYVNNIYDDNKIKMIFYDGNYIVYEYDDFKRISSKTINSRIQINYKYLSNGYKTSNTISELILPNYVLKYKYDKVGNITHVYENGKLKNRYYYDLFNQLIKEKNYSKQCLIEYSYDKYGNLLKKITMNLINYNIINIERFEYSSTEPDKIKKYNDSTFEYDELGNITFDGINRYYWDVGTELSKIRCDNIEYNFFYNEDGVRFQKGDTSYYLDDKKIIYEHGLDKELEYYYDNEDNIIGFRYNNNVYHYLKNISNDIIMIVDSYCNVVAKYEYDSLGNVKTHNYSEEKIGDINPFRWKSYYYDIETGLYYLISRYYNPSLGRFISLDNEFYANEDVLSNNLYLYCSNNYIMGIDYTGDKMCRKNEYFHKYAKDYALKWSSNDNKKRLRNPQFNSYSGDCTNFVSQCMYYGGIRMTGITPRDGWHSYKTNIKVLKFKKTIWNVSRNWASVYYFMKWISKQKFLNKSLVITNYKDIKKAINAGIKAGDIAFLVTDLGKKGEYTHGIVISRVTKDDIFYCAHTWERRDWSLNHYFCNTISGGYKGYKVKFFLLKNKY